MSQILYPGIPSPGEIITLSDTDFHHLVRVRRHTVDDTIQLRTPDGYRVLTAVTEIRANSLSLRVHEILHCETAPYSLTLAMPVLKGRKNDLIVEKGVEVGVTSFIPVFFDRSIPEASSIEKKISRWKKIAAEAFKQSNAVYPVEIHEATPSSALFPLRSSYDAAYVADVHNETLLQPGTVGRTVIIATGPEGGFSEDERESASAYQWSFVSVATHQMRAETASIVLPAMIRHFLSL